MSDQTLPPQPTGPETEPSPPGGLAPLIATKIQVPRRRPDLLPRQRLVNFVHSHLDRKLILISAPAGYGKTTLLADFAHDTDWPVCWYTLDPFDQDLRLFLEYLIASIARQFPAFGRRSRAFLHRVADPGSNLYPIVATLVQEMYDTIPEYFVLILDNHHMVDNQEQINELLDLFVTYVDENCHVILASRTLPALPNLSLLVSRRQAAGLSIDELRFTPHEIQALAQQNYRLELERDQAEIIAQRTGGWITGLLLTAAPRWARAQPEFPLRGRISVDLYDFFSKQVLDQQPPRLRDFLLASSVLEELSPELCDTVLETDEGAALLDQLRSRNLFVVEFEGGENRLRYHDLFRDFLQASLRRQDASRFRELTRRSAVLYDRLGEWERAVSRYQVLQDHACVADIVERTASHLFDSGRLDTLAGWIDALPQAVVEARPSFLVHRAKIHADRGQGAAAVALLDRSEQLYVASGDQSGVSHVLATKGGLLRLQGRYGEAIVLSEQALSTTEGASARERATAALAHKNIGLCQIGLGQVADGRAALIQALRIYEELNDPYDVAMVQHDLGLSHERAGDLAGAVAHYGTALQSWRHLGNPGPWANTLNGLGVVYYLQGSYDEALPILTEALEKAQQAGDLRVEAYTWASLGDLQRDTQAYRQAHEAYTRAFEIARQAHVGFIITYALDGLGNTLRLKGELVQARKQLLRALEHAQANESTYEISLCHTSLGILTAQERDLIAARRHLDQAIGLFEKSGFVQESAKAHLHRAQVAFLAGQREATLADVRHALALAAQLGYDQFLVVEGQALRPLLHFASRHGVGADEMPSLLQRIEAHEARLVARPEPLLAAEGLRALRIHALGQAVVEADGQSVQWPVAQSRELFFCLLQHPQGLSKDRIGETFWPNHAPQKLEGIFRSTLYRLRRALARHAVLYDDGLYRFNQELEYWLDVEAFESLLDRANQSEAPEERIASLVEALALYRGDYLEGIYADWPVVERARLRDRYLAGLELLAKLYLSQGNLERAIEGYQRLLNKEPYYEVAHRELMRCYHQRGDRAAAIRQYQACVDILREDLGLSPSAETQEVYLKVIS